MISHPVIGIVNPGSTSTKLAVADLSGALIARHTVTHDSADLHRFHSLMDQFPFRLRIARDWFHSNISTCRAMVSMGGLLRPVTGGMYRVNDRMLADARAQLRGEHASNLGCLLVHELSAAYSCPALVGDPVSVDEFESQARLSGHPLIQRRSLSHALNIHAAAQRAASELKLPQGRARLVIAHLGGGISVAPVLDGRIIDVNDAASDGPFSPERSGGLPLQQFMDICFSGKHTEREVRSMVMGKGGMSAYLGTTSLEEVERRIGEGDLYAREVLEAMAYQIGKEIGAMATVLQGKLDGIVLTGGAARSPMLVSLITQRVAFLGTILVYPGEDEVATLALRAAAVIQGHETEKEY